MTDRELLALVTVGAPLLAALAVAVSPSRLQRAAALAGAASTAGLGGVLAGVALGDPAHSWGNRWLIVDARSGLLIAVIAVVGAASVWVSRPYLAALSTSVVGAARRDRLYYGLLFLFWATLLAVPLAGNLAVAWLLVEATTATSALLVGFSGKRRALEAGWKYLILTSLGLGVALLGIGFLAAGMPNHGLGDLSWKALSGYGGSHRDGVIAFVLVLAGLAAKIGWAPVHNWLPDAHSEAPPPISGLLSAALLPAVLAVAWRVQTALSPAIGTTSTHSVLIAFGVASIAIAVPFLWQPLPWKRLLAYSSLEHMGVIAVGVGFANPLAIGGVVVHVCGHAVAKALGFYTATPLLSHDPRAAGHLATGIGHTSPRLAGAMGISLGSLAGLPPSPLFASEVLILAGGYESGHPAAATASAILLALGFLGLAHSLIEIVAGKPRRGRGAAPSGLAAVTGLAATAAAFLIGLTALAWVLPSSQIVHALR